MKKTLILLLFFIFLPIFCNAQMANRNDVVINEIAWMGTINSANDEWIELFNTTNNAIDVSGWILKSSNNELKINLKGAIPAGGFYLLERTSDDTIATISADLIYTGTLNNNGEYLKLYDQLSNIIDELNSPIKWPASNASDLANAGWSAGNNATKQTIERINAANWQTGKEPNGTPKAENSAGAIKENPTTSIQTYPEGVIINEILPAPEGKDQTDEWIELYNTNNFNVDLFDWKLQDTNGATTTYIFSKNTTILGRGYLVLKRPETKITLNNDQDGLRLILPTGKVINFMSYSDAPKNQSYNRTLSGPPMQTGWQWSTNITPDSINVATASSPAKTDNKYLAAARESLPLIKNANLGKISPWFLFLTAFIMIVISLVIVLILKLKSNK